MLSHKNERKTKDAVNITAREVSNRAPFPVYLNSNNNKKNKKIKKKIKTSTESYAHFDTQKTSMNERDTRNKEIVRDMR
jgi:hypothetical protein